MFEETLRTLDQLSRGMTYKMDVLPDEDGYYDKECPNEDCCPSSRSTPKIGKTCFPTKPFTAPFADTPRQPEAGGQQSKLSRPNSKQKSSWLPKSIGL